MTLARTFLLPVLALTLLTGSCEQQGSATGEGAPSRPTTEAALPLLVLKDDTADLQLTWVDDAGDFHNGSKIAEVPESSRKRVRVAIAKSDAGHGEVLYVADLTKKKSDGSYSVKTMPRAEWDEIGAKKRQVRMESLRPSADPSPGPSGSAPPSAEPAPRKAEPSRTVRAIIYGADWCKPCHAAEDYLRKRGVQVVKKDIDNSEAALAEMQTKLERAGMSGAQIPIIDVMGQLLVGYNPTVLERAIQTASQSKKL